MTRDHGEDPAAQAAGWYARLRADDATAGDRAAADGWRRADPAHGAAAAQVDSLDTALGGIADDPAMIALRAQALGGASPRPAVQRWPIFATAAALAAVIGTGTILSHREPAEPAHAHSSAGATHYATAIGEQRRIRLPDGSVMTLDAASAVSIPHRVNDRRVDLLAGRAAFAVEKDRVHPFIVATDGNTVTAVGTHFTVERGPDGTMTVALTEGVVRVATPRGTRVMAAGQVLTTTPRSVAVVEGRAADTAGWQDGRLTFAATPLAQVAAALQRYDARRIVIRDAGLAAHPFSGSLRTAGGTDALVAALEAYGTARATRPDATTIVLTPR
ncbi:FecR family protein [Sphingomonas adhaesiva]|uniref:FecR family protein n=1 Tax=Sphingomonas adhaesiva TaxID=28212 RepID=UPI002FF5793B